MEGDLWGEEDDLVKMKCMEDDRNDKEASFLIEDSLHKDVPDTGESQPPPPTRMVMTLETPPPDAKEQESTVDIGNIAEPKDVGTRAVVLNTMNECNEKEDNITIEKKIHRDVTVNGVSLMDLMRKKNGEKKEDKKKSTPVRKKQKKNQEEQNVPPAMPSTGNIEKYLVKKNTTKLTFSSTPGQQSISVRDKIQKFQELSRTVGGECLKSGGRCNTHSCVLVREIVNKKMSKLDKNGKLGWTFGEVTILACPRAETQLESTEALKASVHTGLEGPANKKRRNDLCLSNDQSGKQYQSEGVLRDR